MRFQSVAFALAAHVLVGVSAAPFNIVNDVAKRECLALDSDGNGCQPLISDPAKNITRGEPMTHRCIEVVRDACVRWEPPLPDTHPLNTTTVPKCLEYIEGGCSRWDPPLKPMNRTQLPTCVEHAKNGTDGLKGECTRWDPPIQCRRLPDGKCDFMGLGPVVLKNHTEPQIKCPKKLPDGKCDWMGLGPVELNRTLNPFRDCRTIYRGECIRFGEPLPRLNETEHLNHTLPVFHPLVNHLPEEAGSSTATTTAAAPTATATGALTDEVSDTKRNVLPGVDFVARSPAGDVSKRTNIATNTLTEACPDKDGHCRILPQ